MNDELRTDKQKAIAQAILDDPASSDNTIATRAGASRNLVRRIRGRLGEELPPAPAAVAEVDVVFGPGGMADQVSGRLAELIIWIGQFDRMLAHFELEPRGHFFAFERRRLIQELYTLAGKIQTEIMPAGRCPFCIEGCQRCAQGRWVPGTLVDAFATLEERQKKSRWIRRHFIEVPG